MSCERLPPELVEGIFDYLRQDKRALKTCSLVCKAWLYPAYRRLFSDIRPYSYRLVSAYNPQSDSIAAPFIRRIQFCYSSREWNSVFPSLEGFHSVTSLLLRSLPWDKIRPEVRLTIFSRFFNIVRLELDQVVTTAFSEFAQIICGFRCLESVVIGSTVWHISNRPSSRLRIPQHLRALELDHADFTGILDWFSSFGQDLTLRNICLWGPKERHYRAINDFLRVLGPSLESFRLHLRAVNCPVRLHHNTRLRSLHLDVWRGSESDTGLAPLLSRVISVHTEQVSLSIFQFPSYSNNTLHDRILAEWGDVDAILSRRQFSNLKDVSVRHHLYNRHGPHTEYPLEWFSDRVATNEAFFSCATQGHIALSYDSGRSSAVAFPFAFVDNVNVGSCASTNATLITYQREWVW